MNTTTRMQNLGAYQKAIFTHLEANFGALAGVAVITATPKLIDLAQAPLRMTIEGLELDGLQCLGVAVLQKDRQARASDALTMAKRILVCQALEFATDFLCRASKIAVSGTDPFDEDPLFHADVKDLWNDKFGKAGSLIEGGEREFFEHCGAPLRSCIRYYNGRLYPGKDIKYAGHIRNRSINVNFEWKQKEQNEIALPLSVAYDIFVSIRDITAAGIENAAKGLKA